MVNRSNKINKKTKIIFWGVDMRKIYNFITKYWFVIILGLLILLKQFLVINLPINVRDGSGADEYLMLHHAENLIKGLYLGPYDYLTLVKGIGFPLFLVFAYKIGISYLGLYGLFYSIVCLITLIPIGKMVKNKFLLSIFFCLLLFCPATFDNNVQLVYRNMLIIPQSVLLITSIMMIFYNINESKKKILLWSLISSFTWVFMWHTREDTIWSIPLLVIAWIVLLICLIKNNKIKNISKEFFYRVVLISLPFIILFLSINFISLLNYKYYGIYTNNQLNDSNYTKAVMLMMKVKPEKEIEHVTITRETLLRLYEVSPTLSRLKNIIEYDYINKSSLVMAGDDNGEINEDLITWELTGAANALGYYENAQKAETFWEDVYNEIQAAIDSNKLETRKIMPSRSLLPYPTKEDSLKKLIASIKEVYLYAAIYKYSTINVDKALLEEDIVRRYEQISGGYAVRNDTKKLVVSGWLFSKNNKDIVTIGFENEDNKLIKSISWQHSKDIYNYYKNNGNHIYNNAKQCRYNEVLEIDSSNNENIYVVGRNQNNKIVFSYNLYDLSDFYVDKNYNCGVNNNENKVIYNSDPMGIKANRYVDIARNILYIYSSIGKVVLITSIVYYIILTIYMILNLFKKKVVFFDRWLFLSATFWSLAVMLIGLGYVNAFMLKVNGYLASCNGLLNLFMMTSLVFLIEHIFNFFAKKIKYNKNFNEFINFVKILDFQKLFKEKTDNTLIQFFRYIFVGGIAAIVNIGMLYVFTEVLHIYYLFSNILSFTLGLIVNYFLSKKLVFQEEKDINKINEFAIYTIIGIMGLGIDTMLIWLLTKKTLFHYMISKLTSTMIVFIWNFGARKMLYKMIK